MSFACRRLGTDSATYVYLQNASGSYSQTIAGAAGLRIDADGDLYTTSDAGTYVSRFTWMLLGPSSLYSARVTATGGSPGTFSSGPTSGTWVSLASDQTWTRNSGLVGVPQSVSYTVELALSADTGNVLTSMSGSLSAERTSDA